VWSVLKAIRQTSTLRKQISLTRKQFQEEELIVGRMSRIAFPRIQIEDKRNQEF
jgi:hypothetical protein